MSNIDHDYINSTYITFLRNARNQLLKDTDVYLIQDYPIINDDLVLIKDYRQCLRDFMGSSNVIYYDYRYNSIPPDFPPFPLYSSNV
jgi:hypothetical protein